jgi:acetyltransferase-like isoleucine patch superfamily enzyme
VYDRVAQARFIGSQVALGEGTRVSRTALLRTLGREDEEIVVGDHSFIHDRAMLLSCGGRIRLGDRCSVNPYSIIYGHGGTVIGDDVRIASHCVIVPGNHVFAAVDVPIAEQGVTCVGITIGSDVWLGTGSTILDDVVVGDGAIVAAGAVVTRDVPPTMIVAGIPARRIGTRGESVNGG